MSINNSINNTLQPGFFVGATSVTSTGVQLNYVNTATGVTGTASVVLSNSPTLVTPALGVPSALTLTNATGLPIGGITGLGTGVATALAAGVSGSGNIVLVTSATLITPALGTPSALVLTNATGLPLGSTGVTGVLLGLNGGTGVANTGLTITLSGGAAGLVLTSDSSGNATWAASGQAPFVNVTGTTQALANDTDYMTQNVGLTTFTLPATAAVGTGIRIYGHGTGGYTVTYGVGQYIQYGTATTTVTSGSLSSVTANGTDQCFLTCSVTNTGWVASSPIGALNAA